MAHHLSPNDVVPQLRTDLKASPPPTGTGAEVIRVGPADGTAAMQMHGFEFSIARMLDGRRTAKDVLNNCERLGLPVNLDALEDFVSQLKSHGLISAETQALKPRNWPGNLRQAYRDALKCARENDVEGARKKLGEMLNIAPGTIEAVRLLQWLDDHPDTAAHGKSFQELFDTTRLHWSEERPPHWAAEARDAVRRSMWPLIGLVGTVAVLAYFAFTPQSRRVDASGELQPLTEVAVTSPQEGIVGEIAVVSGQLIEAGTPLFTWDTDDLRLRLNDAAERLDAARTPVRDFANGTTEGQQLLEAEKMAEIELARAQAQQLAAQRADPAAVSSEALTTAQQHLTAARGAVDALSDGTPEAVTAKAITDEVTQLLATLADPVVVASAQGYVSHLYTREGQKVTAGQRVLQIDQLDRLKLVASMSPKSAKNVQVGSPIVVHVGDKRIETKAEAVSGYEIAAEVPNADLALKTGSVAVEIELPATSKNPAVTTGAR